MDNQIRQGLLNAGFQTYKNHQTDPILRLCRSNREVIINIFNNSTYFVSIYKDPNDPPHLKEKQFFDLAELNRLCYGHILQDLNFEAKKYTWEECLNRKEGYYIDQCSQIEKEHTFYVGKDHTNKNIVPTRSNAESILATTQLMQICARINADFENLITPTVFKFYPVLIYQDGVSAIDFICRDEKINQFSMNSQKAIDTLIETNSPLLMKYFENQPF